MLTIVTANVDGIRAAARRGLDAWLADRRPDLLCLQEVRAPDPVLLRVAPVAVRAWFDQLLGADGFVDVQRSLAGEGPRQYTWWPWRGTAFDSARRTTTMRPTAGQRRRGEVCAPC